MCTPGRTPGALLLMPERNERQITEIFEKLLSIAASAILFLGFFSGHTTLSFASGEQTQDLVFSDAFSAVFPGMHDSVEQDEYRGQKGLSQMFFSGETPRLPALARSRNFGLNPEFMNVSRRYRTWVRGFGNWSSVGAPDSSTDWEYHSYGFSLGIDQQIGRNLLLGVALRGNKISVQGKKIQGRIRQESDISATHVSIYVRTSLDRIYFDLEGGLGYNDQSYPAQTGMQWNLNAETGTWWGHGLAKVEPFLGLRHVSLDTDPGTETKTTLIGGLRYSWKTTGTFAVITPRFYGGVIQELGDRNLMNAAMFVDAPTVFTIPGGEIAQTRFFFGGGFTSAMGRSLDLYIRYTAEIASKHASHTAMFGMNWNF